MLFCSCAMSWSWQCYPRQRFQPRQRRLMLAEFLLILLFEVEHVTERGKQGFKILPVGLVSRLRGAES